MPEQIEVDCCIAGGGPAGVMAGLLFARAGCSVLVLEKHADFLRDFRGDTVHPSTLEIMQELGLLDAFLKRPHQRLSRLSGVFGNEPITLTDFSSLQATCRFIAFMPQWHFLDFLADAGASLPGFKLRMSCEASGLIQEQGRHVGVRAETSDGPLEVRARLVIGADGRHSRLREQAGLKVKEIGAPIDVLWFRLPRGSNERDEPLFHAGAGHVLITLDRGDYWQCAFVIPKGQAETVKARGIAAFRDSIAATVPEMGDAAAAIENFEEVKLLTVKIDRLERWSRPGLLFIGDAAHAMSPVGGVGINLAVQDAVAAANLLAGPLAGGRLTDGDLEAVRLRREWPTRATQFLQTLMQNNVVSPILAEKQQIPRPPLALKLVSRIGWLQRRAAAVIGLGLRPEHVRSPQRYEVRV